MQHTKMAWANAHCYALIATTLGAPLLNACVGEVDAATDSEETMNNESPLTTEAYSQCDDILAAGLYNSFLTTKNEMTAGVLTDWKCDEFRRSGKVDTDYWGYGKVSADASWELAKKTCESVQHSYTASSFSTYALAQTVDQGVVSAWRDCMGTYNRGFVCDIEPPQGTSNILQFHIDWQTIARDSKLSVSWATQINVLPRSVLPTTITTEGASGYDFAVTNPKDAASVRVNAAGAAGAFTCNIVVYPKPAPLPRPAVVPIACQVIGDNAGCSTTVSCPRGKHVAGARAACNLEYGAVTGDQMSKLPRDTLRVVRASDVVKDGNCSLGGINISSGERGITSLQGKKSVVATCREHDKNQGECHIRGELVCVAD